MEREREREKAIDSRDANERIFEDLLTQMRMDEKWNEIFENHKIFESNKNGIGRKKESILTANKAGDKQRERETEREEWKRKERETKTNEKSNTKVIKWEISR